MSNLKRQAEEKENSTTFTIKTIKKKVGRFSDNPSERRTQIELVKALFEFATTPGGMLVIAIITMRKLAKA